MQQARMLGYRVQKFANTCNVSPLELSEIIGCSETEMKLFLKGRAFISYEQLSLLAKKLKVEISALLSGNEDEYNKSIVHCMNDFDKPQNREFILDIIDEYMDILDVTCN
ncbi:MAG: helix-turn-helix transcriptional regulator [Clostridia bacterium]|nr:helix-turn-helix transcriptional regulator [Clostridia bacterium]